jgi:PAS domain S-box-containing protein/putative nucleotidyltransferase with HDIG domain
LPLLSGKQVIGVLAIGSPYGSPYHFDSVTIEILNQFARLAAVAVQNARLFSDLQVELTERKRAEEALRERDQQFRSITAASPDTLLVTRVSDGLIRYANEQAGRLVGLAASDLINRVTPDFYTHPEDRQTFVAMLKRGFVSDWEVLLKRADNTPFWAMVSARLGNFEGDAVIYAGLRDITDRKRREQELQAIATLITAARTAPTRAEMLPVILDQVLDLLEMGGATLAIRNLTTGEITFELGRGQWANFTGVQLSPDNSVAGHVIATGQRYTSDDVKSDPLLTRPDLIGDLNCVACVPLTVQGQTIGALWAGRQTPIREEEVRLLTSIADIAANAIHRATLHEQTQKHAADLAQAYDRTLEGWAHALELRDQETEGHTRRVVQMTLDLARAMGVGEAEMEDIRRGALLHDIGKMGVPDSVLLKPGTFNEREWEIMQRHSEYARNLLAPIDYLRPAMDIPYCHHEKWDGTGYPRGLKSEEIPIAARIFAIVDVWDALTSDRPYRKAWTEEKVLGYIREQSSKHFDPRVVEAFLKIVR